MSVSEFPGPERGIFGISIIDIISRNALIGFSLLHASYYYNRKGPVIVDNLMIIIIHRGLFIIIILHSKCAKVMIDIYFIIGYSTVKIERISDQYLFYYNCSDIE